MTVWSQLTLWDDCVGFGFFTYIVFFSFLQMDELPKTEVSNGVVENSMSLKLTQVATQVSVEERRERIDSVLDEILSVPR